MVPTSVNKNITISDIDDYLDGITACLRYEDV